MSTEETDTPQPPDDDHPQPRRRSRLAVVSVAAAVLVAGGGGAYWASTAAGGGSQGAGSAGRDGSPQPLALDAYAAPAGHEGIAVGEPDPNGSGRYEVDGKLPDGPDEAPVYRTDAKVTKADVARLAKALDVSGSPRAEHGNWKVGGTKDGQGPVLRVSQKGPGSWSYSRFGTPGGGTCVHPPGAGPKADSTSCPTYRDGEKKSGTDKSGGDDKAVSEEKAKRTAEPVLKALGLTNAKLDASGRYGAVRMVNADPVLDKLPTQGWTTSLQVGADGQLTGGNGALSTPEEDDSYPLISAEQALKKLNATAPKSGGTGSGKVTVKSVTFGLASHSVAGQRALVPSWIFKTEPTGANGVSATLPYPAVKPEFIKKKADTRADTGGKTPGQGKKHSEPGTPGRGSKADDITSYSADGKTLTLRFWGGVCDTYSVSADETSKKVTVEVKSKPKRPGQACILMAKEMTKKITLDKPLDGREVVDKATGDKVPAQKK
ncbi:hypothetical protein [Streptomyces sp. Rer75]|uniref:hypothetical protein n=1 Tax=Streptomyces sp. Rer75 TaxID=2750011 RepID=UPI0015D0D0BE|nr:hypothetical protein [Streptomyces sp. Rer75]QLH21262.1 hypothetical protein HYQ63_12015 [Streptomyces sp. Rer75]